MNSSMISYSNALSILREAAIRSPLTPESVPLSECVGRTAAETLTAEFALPEFPNSGMDGFAVQASCTVGASPSSPVRLPVLTQILAGDPLSVAAESTRTTAALEIMTGAPIPPGPWDSVVKVEDVRVTRDSSGRALEIEIFSPVEAHQFTRAVGSDFEIGDRVLCAGTQITPEHLLVLAAHGLSHVSVYRRLHVAVIATGAELVPHDAEVVPPGRVRNTTTPYLMAAFQAIGAQVRFFGATGDDPALFKERVARAMESGSDLIVSTGAVSMGQKDFVPEALAEMGAKTLFHRVAVKPGKPLLAAELPGDVLFLGVPGNPVSTAVAFEFFIRPWIAVRHGSTQDSSSPRSGDNSGLTLFLRAKRQPDGHDRVIPNQISYRVSPFVESDRWVVETTIGGVGEKGKCCPS